MRTSAAPRLTPAELRHDHLAEVSRLRHVAKCVGNLRQRKHLRRQWQQPPGLGVVEELRPGAAEPLAVARHFGSEVHRVIGGLRREARGLCRRQQLALADLEETAAGAEQGQALRDELADERVQHHVDAAAAGGRQHFRRRKTGSASRRRAATPSARRKSRFSAVPAVAKITAPAALRQLHRGQADAASGGMNQDALAAAQLADAHSARTPP